MRAYGFPDVIGHAVWKDRLVRRIAVVALLLGLLLAACGGGGGRATGTIPAEFTGDWQGAGPAVPGLDVLLRQNELLLRAQGASEEQIRTRVDNVRQVGELLRAGDISGAQQQTRRLAEREGTPAAQIDAQVAEIAGLRHLVSYDPGPALAALQVPVFAFYGSKDLQVPPSQSESPLRAALAGNPDATIRVFDGLNHLMQPAQTGLPSEYGTIETTIDPTVLAAVTDWLKAH